MMIESGMDMCRQVSERHHPFYFTSPQQGSTHEKNDYKRRRPMNGTSFGEVLQPWTTLSVGGQKTTKA